MTDPNVTRYHPALVALHWIMALGIFLLLVVGGPMLAKLASNDPMKITGMQGHMAIGMIVGLLLALRLALKLLTRTPPHADAGHKALNSGAKLAHIGLYVLMAGMVGSGIAMAFAADLFAIAYGGADLPVPEDMTVYTPRVAHGVIGKLLLALILAHLAGVLYHMVLRRDRLLRRMWFGKRTV